MKKHILDFAIRENIRMSEMYALLKLSPLGGRLLPEMKPGQFVQVEVPDSKNVFLRRPISINFVDYDRQELWLLVRDAGEGTHRLVEMPAGQVLNLVLPLGRGFTLPEGKEMKLLLVGGGVGVAPLLYLGAELKKGGFAANFLLGARSATDLLEKEEFSRYGNLYLSTDDGSFGEKGLVTQNSALCQSWDMIYCCGPMPMMKAVAAYALRNGVECEVSLENRMACGIGACLCCVEDTDKGNQCVCTEGPIFNVKQLKWGI